MISKTALIAALVACLPVAALAERLPEPSVDLGNPFSVARQLQEWGYRAEIEESDGRATLYSGSLGDFFYIDFYWCDAPKSCNAMMFMIEYDTNAGVTLEQANNWNQSRIMGRMSLNDDCDLVMSHFALTGHTVPVQVFSDMIGQWETVIADLQALVRDVNFETKGKVVTCDGKNVPI